VFGKRAEEAEDAISRAGAMLDVLHLSKADLSPADRLFGQAREALNRKSYDSARVLATRAETLASTLEDRHRAAQKALGALRGLAKQARELGLDASEFDGDVAEARRVAQAGTVEDGVKIPDYNKARAMLETAVNAGRERLKIAQETANEIFTAELALDALNDENALITLDESDRVTSRGRALVDDAKQALAAGRFDEAKIAARKTEAAARQALLARRDAIAALHGAERRVAALQSMGALADVPEKLIVEGMVLLRAAKIAEARGTFEIANREAQRIRDEFRRASKGVKDAKEGLASLARSGTVPETAERALRDAQQVFKGGEYDRAAALASDARKALGKRHEVRERIARTIEETRRKLEELRATGTEYANDVEEMLVRAEEEFENGDFVTSSEDLKIANLLIGPLPGTANPAKSRSAPAGNP